MSINENCLVNAFGFNSKCSIVINTPEPVAKFNRNKRKILNNQYVFEIKKPCKPTAPAYIQFA